MTVPAATESFLAGFWTLIQAEAYILGHKHAGNGDGLVIKVEHDTPEMGKRAYYAVWRIS